MIRGARVARLVAALLGAQSIARTQSVPRDLSELATAARIDRPVAAWCRAEFRPGRPGAYAVAVADANGGGRYLVLDTDTPALELAVFSAGPELACYTPAAARRLNATIERSETIQGGIAPRWKTTVVCGFVENTHAVCWQYSPAGRAVVKIGEWTT
jgi:hypothetical protein